MDTKKERKKVLLTVDKDDYILWKQASVGLDYSSFSTFVSEILNDWYAERYKDSNIDEYNGVEDIPAANEDDEIPWL